MGKSTLAVHLAGLWAGEGRRVVLLDEDGRVGSAAAWGARLNLEMRPKKIKHADVVVIDAPGQLGRKGFRALSDRADVVLIPCGPSSVEVEATRRLFELLSELPNVRGVISRAPPVGRAGRRARDELGEAMLKTVVRSYHAYLVAAERGLLARDVRGGASAWGDVVALAGELAGGGAGHRPSRTGD